MRFLLDDEQRAFAHSLDAMLSAADVPAAARAWSQGDPAPGRALWSRLADAGVFALAVPEQFDGVGPLPLELTLAFEALGRHAVPGPAAETVAAAVLLAELGDPALAKAWLPGLANGSTLATLQAPGSSASGGGPLAGQGLGVAQAAAGQLRRGSRPRAAAGSATTPAPFVTRFALDADSSDAVFVVTGASGDELRLTAGHGPLLASHDPARRLFEPTAGGELLASGPAVTAAASRAGRWAALLTAAQALGVGRALLARTVAYVRERRQFGTEIGAFQAVKHRLADVLIALEFAQPLVHAAALSLDPRDVAMAKVAAGEAGYAAARAALQLHGAIGYTEELDLSLWLRKARPLRDAWGAPAGCRALVVAGCAFSATGYE